MTVPLSLNFSLLSLPPYQSTWSLVLFPRARHPVSAAYFGDNKELEGKCSLSSLLRPHTKLTNSNSHGDHFWPIACKLPRRRIATDPTHAHTGGGECSTHERARAEREEGDLRNSSMERNIGVCARFSTEKFWWNLKGHRKNNLFIMCTQCCQSFVTNIELNVSNYVSDISLWILDCFFFKLGPTLSCLFVNVLSAKHCSSWTYY